MLGKHLKRSLAACTINYKTQKNTKKQRNTLSLFIYLLVIKTFSQRISRARMCSLSKWGISGWVTVDGRLVAGTRLAGERAQVAYDYVWFLENLKENARKRK